jgi:hypothetical protein
MDTPSPRLDFFAGEMTCLACKQVHLVNPKTGKVLGELRDFE